ncbi:PPE domain-containing protein [Mycobacterium eburneum]|nr:PPE domain-containing protein [Mycobacterium eburneum]
MALDPRWMGPPEVVAAILEAGPGPGSTIANQLVWITETISHELSMGLSAVNTAATATQWIGLGGAASTVSATGLNAGLQTMVGWTTHKVSVVQAALDAYACARPAVIPSVVCQTNRDEWAALMASNILGQNTPAIIERDMEYFGEHWPHNSSVGLTYSGALSALTAALAVPPPVAPMGASPAAPASAATAVAEAAANPGDAVGAPAQAVQAGAQAAASPGEMTAPLSSVFEQGSQLVSSATEPLNSVGQASGQVFQGVSSMPQTLLGTFSAVRPTDVAATDVAATEAATWRAGVAGGIGAGSGGAGVGGVGGGGYPGAALASFTRPASTFTPEEGGRPLGRAGVLNAAELRGPTTTFPMGGAPVPVSSAGAGMLGRAPEGASKEVARARIVVDEQRDR